MKTLNEKIIERLQDKHDSFLGADGQKSRDDFKNGLSWAIDSIETLTKKAEFEEIARQLMKHLAEEHYPHVTAIVTSTNAELVEGIQSTGKVLDYVVD